MECNLGQITFFAGEERTVDAVVSTTLPQELIVVTGATWTLTNKLTGAVAASGDCEIDGAKLTVFFGSEITGYYTLEVTAHVGRETIKQRCGVTFV